MHTARRLAKSILEGFAHLVGRTTKRYYFEDYVRVYPDQVAYNRLGLKRRCKQTDLNNFLNHCRFYEFAAQFVRDRSVVDVGCGSGYGCDILARHGASKVSGCDLSKHAVGFARRRYGQVAAFTEQAITDLHGYADFSFDVAICSEVIEHIKEYHLEDKAVAELRRVTRKGGIVIIGTPNSELLADHGFTFEEIHSLLAAQFDSFCIFENALVPFGEQRQAWLRRLAVGKTGIVVSERIKLDETVLPDNAETELKAGIEPGLFRFEDVDIDTALLHNTHSWVAIGRV